MSGTIILPEEIEHRLREDALRQGLPAEELVSCEVTNP